MKTLLIEPLVDTKTKWGKFEPGKGFIPPMGIMSIYSYLRSKGKDVRFIDTQFGDFTENDIRKILSEDKEIKVVGMSAFTPTAYFTFRMAKICKEIRPDIKVVLGGFHASILPERSLRECPWVDYIVLREGELTFLELVDKIEKNESPDDVDGICYLKDGMFVSNKPRCFIENLDDLPYSSYDEIDISRYLPHPTQYKVLPNFPFLTQRGCPYNCAFCNAGIVHGKKVRSFSTDRVVSELELLTKQYGARGVYFQDSTFTINKAYVRELCQKLISKGIKLKWACNTRCDRVDVELLELMKRAGCWMINYGVESANQKSLDMLKKGITIEQVEKSISDTKRVGIDMTCNFILCIPGENAEMVENTIKFSKKLFPDIALFWLPIPFPGTELEDLCKKDGGYKENAKWEDFIAFDFDNLVYVNPNFGVEGMMHYNRKAFKDFYLNFRYIAKMFVKIRSLDDIKRYYNGLRVILNAFV
ncbi:MAG: radical SAM protein [Endomicrobiales bacterium]|nr:radical SAM protein [Endomicrobiales bacterium]